MSNSEPSRALVITVYQPGPAWDAGREIEDQPGWPENLEYWKTQTRTARMRAIGAIAGAVGTVLAVWHALGLEEVECLVAETPLIKSGVLKARTAKGVP